jgi:glycosyltransferase involved in cell wall biosynthesis
MSDAMASIVIPTRGRPAYLDAALASVAPQATDAGAELLVVDDGAGEETAAVAARHGARLIATGARHGANAARNAGVAASTGDPVIFLDDDVHVPAGWLASLLDGVASTPGPEVFGGPIRAAIEPAPHSCGREGPPITHLELGAQDRDTDLVWSANMAIRRAALERIGPFDETIHGRGEEEDWERRYAAAGGRIRYLAAAGLDHRRIGADARLPALSRAAYALGRTARRYDVRRGTAPPVWREVWTVAACLVHVARFRCPNMIPGAAHASGRLREALRR